MRCSFFSSYFFLFSLSFLKISDKIRIFFERKYEAQLTIESTILAPKFKVSREFDLNNEAVTFEPSPLSPIHTFDYIGLVVTVRRCSPLTSEFDIVRTNYNNILGEIDNEKERQREREIKSIWDNEVNDEIGYFLFFKSCQKQK